jgi:hypothetical protein
VYAGGRHAISLADHGFGRRALRRARCPRCSDSYAAGRVSRSRLERLDSAILAYELVQPDRRGPLALPKTLDLLVSAGLIERSDLKDPWARPYHYALTESGYLLNASMTAGGRSGLLIEDAASRSEARV